MLEKNYLKNLLQKNGIKIGYLCSVLNIDRQKFDRWREDDHPNNIIKRLLSDFFCNESIFVYSFFAFNSVLIGGNMILTAKTDLITDCSEYTKDGESIFFAD